MSGQQTLDALMIYCKKVTDALEPIAAKSRNKPKMKTVHSIIVESTNPNVRTENVIVPTIHVSKAPERKSTKPAPWWTNGLKFPCGLLNHDHEVSMCTEFFFMTPAERVDYVPRSKVCRTCLGPRVSV